MYLGIDLKLHGLIIKEADLPIIKRSIKEAVTNATSKFKNKDRPDFESDVEVEIYESAL